MRGDWNPLAFTDSYKMGHFRQYPPETRCVYSYFESRGSDRQFGFRETVFFGLQYLLEQIAGVFVTPERIDRAEHRCRRHFGDDRNFNRSGWEHIVAAHGGRLPVRIRAVAEGSVVPTHNCLMTIENTDPACYWLTNWLETMLVQVWYPTTVATQSREMKRVLLRYLAASGDPAAVDFKLHDFGCRGVSSVETAAIGGAAHLVNFRGTDNLPALELLAETYGDACGGFSIPASEHSTITSWGEAHELDAMRNMLEQYPTGTVACVSDSFDVFRACRDYWGGALRDQVLHRNGTLVIRPDSGDPATVVCQVLDILGSRFPTTTNAKGFKLLDRHVRLIQGDGVDFTSLGTILEAVTRYGWSADNLAFGSGGGLLQKLNRDTLKFAFKCSSITVGDAPHAQQRDVYKRPVTDNNKQSKSGRFKLIRRDGPDGATYATVHEHDAGDDELRLVFENGSLIDRTTLADVRRRAAVG
ncbi:MAG TPA: nicotinate phosphoribosyltransferase [Pirellulales bacterium]|jgi:nicotinamide phosphoribosyltransferase|nr:nicotinate phosphoribosyltransferase [Pirellulales bacterium]